jgi:transposase
MTDAEWAVIEPLLPAPGWMLGRGGSPGSYCRRDIVNGIRYLAHNGPVWQALPADLPHWRTIYGYVHGIMKESPVHAGDKVLSLRRKVPAQAECKHSFLPTNRQG